MKRPEPEGCPHDFAEMIVRIGCHDDLMSAECRAGAQLSMWCCGRPQCKARCMAEVFAFTGIEPVLVYKTRKPLGVPPGRLQEADSGPDVAVVDLGEFITRQGGAA